MPAWLQGAPPGVPLNIPGVWDGSASRATSADRETTSETATALPVTESTSSSISRTNDTATQTTGSSGSGSTVAGCPKDMKGVTFNGGVTPAQVNMIKGLDHWITFGPDIPGGAAEGQAATAFIPMMAFEKDVTRAKEIINTAHPEWMLTFNEPDHKYDLGGGDGTPTMEAAYAARVIQQVKPLAGGATRFVGPATADPYNPWHEAFYAACDCQSMFSAYNVHLYTTDLAVVKKTLTDFHTRFSDKPIWLTEIAPGMANPPCSVPWDAAAEFMRGVYKFAKESGFIDRVFWNSGNQLTNGDTNVCNSWLVDAGLQPSPLLDAFASIDCS
ncbi:MAG: hypothetical protein LQ351_001598 [Letrouitia transgressa]|nr:MAG: hypothetical protein LQ351_001598 [Letrouitia transgressa]